MGQRKVGIACLCLWLLAPALRPLSQAMRFRAFPPAIEITSGRCSLTHKPAIDGENWTCGDDWNRRRTQIDEPLT